MVLRVGQVEREALGRDHADDALAHAQPRAADRLGVQPVRGDEFEDLAGAEDVDGADIGDEFRRHGAHEVGQHRRPRHAVRDQLAQAGEQAARGAHPAAAGALEASAATA